MASNVRDIYRTSDVVEKRRGIMMESVDRAYRIRGEINLLVKHARR